MSSFTIDHASGKLTPLNTMSVKSAGPCYIGIDKSADIRRSRRITRAAALPCCRSAATEGWERLRTFIQHKGSGPNRDRQTMPHPHWVGFIPASKLALVADLGMDEVAIYNFDAKKGKLTVGNPAFMTMPPGSGPRHGAMHHSGTIFHT